VQAKTFTMEDERHWDWAKAEKGIVKRFFRTEGFLPLWKASWVEIENLEIEGLKSCL
jgi:hypothetical protein